MTALRERELGTGEIELLEAEAAAELARRGDSRWWIERNLWIRSKGRQTIPLHLNRMQADYYARRSPSGQRLGVLAGRRDRVLKFRQGGQTTLITALFLADTLLTPNTYTVQVAHDTESTELIFGIVIHYWRHLPEAEKERVGAPRFANRREFFWPNINSRYLVGTAGRLTVGRGLTINNLHCSEVAFWEHPEESMTALLEAVPREGCVVEESTPNGMGGYFHTAWQEAKEAGEGASYRQFFYPWWWDGELRVQGSGVRGQGTAGAEGLGDLSEEERGLVEGHGLDGEQIAWRRWKRAQPGMGDRFAQEYPEDDVTCFLVTGRPYFNLLGAEELRRAHQRPALEVRRNGELQIWKRAERGHAYLLAADVAEGKEETRDIGLGAEQGGPDYSHLEVMDWDGTGEEVACYHGRLPEVEFAHLIFELQQEYPGLVAVERNNTGAVVLVRLMQLAPRWIYLDPEDRRAGWRTTAGTRHLVLQALYETMEQRALAVHDEGFWREVRAFHWTRDGTPRALPASHDDRILARAIGQYLMRQPALRPDPEELWRAAPAPAPKRAAGAMPRASWDVTRPKGRRSRRGAI